MYLLFTFWKHRLYFQSLIFTDFFKCPLSTAKNTKKRTYWGVKCNVAEVRLPPLWWAQGSSPQPSSPKAVGWHSTLGGSLSSRASCPPAVLPTPRSTPPSAPPEAPTVHLCARWERCPTCRCSPSLYLLLSRGPHLITDQSLSTEWSPAPSRILKTCKYCRSFAIF